MTDLVDRLRAHVNNRGGASIENGAWQMMLDAADEIERLLHAAEEVCGWDTANDHPDFSRDIEALRRLLRPESHNS